MLYSSWTYMQHLINSSLRCLHDTKRALGRRFSSFRARHNNRLLRLTSRLLGQVSFFFLNIIQKTHSAIFPTTTTTWASHYSTPQPSLLCQELHFQRHSFPDMLSPHKALFRVLCWLPIPLTSISRAWHSSQTLSRPSRFVMLEFLAFSPNISTSMMFLPAMFLSRRLLLSSWDSTHSPFWSHMSAALSLNVNLVTQPLLH